LLHRAQWCKRWLPLALRHVASLLCPIVYVFSVLQADPVTECSEPNPAIWALRQDHEELRNGHVSVTVIIIIIIIIITITIILIFHKKPGLF
jgi:hypothetical protein